MSDTPGSKGLFAKVHSEEAFEVTPGTCEISRCGHGLKERQARKGTVTSPCPQVVTSALISSERADDAFDQIVRVFE
jgi:hypothetical protein